MTWLSELKIKTSLRSSMMSLRASNWLTWQALGSVTFYDLTTQAQKLILQNVTSQSTFFIAKSRSTVLFVCAIFQCGQTQIQTNGYWYAHALKYLGISLLIDSFSPIICLHFYSGGTHTRHVYYYANEMQDAHFWSSTFRRSSENLFTKEKFFFGIIKKNRRDNDSRPPQELSLY
jgi:hypothetical protein